jgi:hypothetical protein
MLVPLKDFLLAAALEAVIVGAKTAVSSLCGGDQPRMAECISLWRRSAKNGRVYLFVPSQFGVESRRWVLEAAKETELPVLSAFVGYFSDVYIARVIGDGSAKKSFALRSDVGYALISCPRPTSKVECSVCR